MTAPIFPSPDSQIEELISASTLQQRVAELGRQITADYADKGDNLVLLAVLKGSVVFLADLCRHIQLPLAIEFIGIASYGDETHSSGVVQITSDVTRPIENRDVIVVEDIIDTGLTASYLVQNLTTRNPASVKLCSLLHKPDRTDSPIPIDYLGFSVPDRFVVGYGIDFSQRFRNLPYIGALRT